LFRSLAWQVIARPLPAGMVKQDILVKQGAITNDQKASSKIRIAACPRARVAGHILAKHGSCEVGDLELVI